MNDVVLQTSNSKRLNYELVALTKPTKRAFYKQNEVLREITQRLDGTNSLIEKSNTIMGNGEV